MSVMSQTQHCSHVSPNLHLLQIYLQKLSIHYLSLTLQPGFAGPTRQTKPKDRQPQLGEASQPGGLITLDATGPALQGIEKVISSSNELALVGTSLKSPDMTSNIGGWLEWFITFIPDFKTS